MKRLLQLVGVSVLLLTSASTTQAQVSIGIRVGQPPPERAYRVPNRPGPEYVWVEGYQYPEGRRFKWHDGYWTRPPYEGAYWAAPYYYDGQYYAGQWEGSRNMAHNHGWDRRRQRDDGRNDRDNNRGRNGRR